MVTYDPQKGITALGLMSGTSLDGLDLCLARFTREQEKWSYSIICADAATYPGELKNALATAQSMTAFEYARLHSDYGVYLGVRVRSFMEKHKVKPQLVASHGHTIFHQPSVRLTSQIGSGAGIAAESGIPVVCDFRTTDVALHGQGAPLVPVGDRYLFGDFDYCLNLGGFSNISSEAPGGSREAYDITAVNYVLNHYTRAEGEDFDKDGMRARRGTVHYPVLDALNRLPFYRQKGPKSLGREWVEGEIFPLIDSFGLTTDDALATYCEHIAVQTSFHIRPGAKVLVTGGGAFNRFLMERMTASAPAVVYHVPDNLTVNFKEALIFAFLGVLYVCDIPSCLSSVTGSLHDNIGGALYKC
ncbi:MAG: anhydro-N-acetylmuramic acid kinase [Bacteroidales bacterium]|jgi:anhydro-N-acetylmuramic acid kinase